MDIPAHIRDSSNPRPRRGHRLRRLSVSACVFRLEQRQQGAGDAADAFTGFFGFVEQVEDAQRSDRRLQTGCSGLLIPDTDLGENPCRERGA